MSKAAEATVSTTAGGMVIKTAKDEMNKKAGINRTKEEIMRRPFSLILAVILLIICSGCFWGWEHDRRGYDDRDRGGYDGYRHDDRRDFDDQR